MSSKKKDVLPIFGKPIFVINRHPFADKIKKDAARLSGCLSGLMYFATNAIMVTSVGYTDESMEHCVINKDTDAEMEFSIDELNSPDNKRVFFNLNEADSFAASLNIEEKLTYKGIMDALAVHFHEYDKIIAAQEKIK